ncbi:MAG: [protein-PII] uridylyltransferase [Succinivibrio sp.]|nr:[protein-PII] uridylyltransferase [Succinivibrio sp.]
MFESIVVPKQMTGTLTEFVVNSGDFASLKATRELIERHQEYLKQSFTAGCQVEALLHERSDFFDRLLKKIYELHGLKNFDYLCLAATGGYGRREMFLESDVDILICSKLSPLPEDAARLIENFVSYLWDLKLDLGSSVRSIEDAVLAARSDLTIKTTLLETRLIGGSKKVYRDLCTALKADDFWNAHKFLNAKLDEQIARYHAYRDTAFSIEPDVKNNPGALRDLHVLHWIAILHLNATTSYDMFKAHLFSEPEYAEFLECRTFLRTIRYALHCVQGGNRLTLDAQKQVALLLGYGSEGNAPVEKMMRALFRTFRRVRDINTIVMQLEMLSITGQIGNDYAEPVFLNNWFIRRGTLIDVVDQDLFIQDPVKFIELFATITDHPEIRGVNFNCLRALRECRRQLKSHLIEIPSCRKLFKQILSNPECVKTALPLMNETRVLAAYMPQWEHIEGLMQFDMFHLFSVDEHTIRVLKYLADFLLDSAPYNDLYKKVYHSLDEPQLLIVAALLHDIAKGRGGHHAEMGAKEAGNFCQLHGYTSYQTHLVCWLIDSHLLFSHTAQRRDISDPDVIENFASSVGDEEHLNLLYCLTVCDLLATNESEWNSWKESMFRQLYYSTRTVLRGEHDAMSNLLKHAQEVQQQILEDQPDPQTKNKLRHYFELLPSHYFMHYGPEEIVWHARNILRYGSCEKPLILFAQMQEVGTEVLVYVRNITPMLFGALALALTHKSLNVLSAQIFMTHDSHMLATLVVQNRQQQMLDNERLNSLRQAMLKQLEETPVIAEVPTVPLKSPALFEIPTKLTFLEGEHKHTNLEISTLDEPGLLAKIGITFGNCGCLISAARITTTGERADDFFSICDLKGLPLDARTKEALSLSLMEVLSGQHKITTTRAE